ncbi:hypothetical protein P7K49_032396, partial [Saguinus oedipus]
RLAAGIRGGSAEAHLAAGSPGRKRVWRRGFGAEARKRIWRRGVRGGSASGGGESGAEARLA